MNISREKFEKIQELVNDGYVRKTSHDVFNNLAIYTYTQKAEFEEIWNSKPEARICRGLVLDNQTLEIVCPCIEKFFNHDTEFAPRLSMENCEITTKEDGYMIQVICHEKYGRIITSKGSFNNKYTEFVENFIDTLGTTLENNRVYICELLNNFQGDEGIIVTKHDTERLVCFAIKNIETGEELKLDNNCPFELVNVFTANEAKEYLKKEVEGVVLHDWKTGQRVKMKTQWFFAMHRLISNCTKSAVYDLLRDNKRVEDLDIPDEFMKQMKQWQYEIESKFELYKHTALMYQDTFSKMPDKDFAALSGSAVPKFYVSLVFMLRKNKTKQFEEMIWRKIKENL